jgi:hypothetical protein
MSLRPFPLMASSEMQSIGAFASPLKSLADDITYARINVMINRASWLTHHFTYLKGCAGWVLR